MHDRRTAFHRESDILDELLTRSLTPYPRMMPSDSGRNAPAATVTS